MSWNFEDENKPYSSDDAYEDLESIKAILADAQRRINRSKLEKSGIELNIKIDVEGNQQ